MAKKETLLIKTTAGNTLLPPEKRVWVKVGEMQVAPKEVQHLTPGDKVIVGRTKIQLTLKQITDALLEDDISYKHAHSLLHLQTEEGHKTRLQAFLEHIHNFSQEELKNDDNLKKAIQTVKNRLENAKTKTEKRWGKRDAHDFEIPQISRSDTTIKQWLTGQTVLPSNLWTLRVLRALNRTKFDELFGSIEELKKGEGSDLAWAHKHWKTNHSVLANWVSGFASSPDEKFELPERESTVGEKSKTGQSLANQREIIYSKLIKPVWEQITQEHGFARVNGVEPIEAKKQKIVEKGPVLSRGVLTTDKDITNMPVKETSFADLQRKEYLLQYLMQRIITPLVPGSEQIQDVVASAIIRSEEKKNLEKLAEQEITLGDGKTKITKTEFLSKIDETEKKIAKGEADDAMGFSEGTIRSILTRLRQMQKQSPIYEPQGQISFALNIWEKLYEDQEKKTIKEKNKIEQKKAGRDYLKKFKQIRNIIEQNSARIERYGGNPYIGLIVPEIYYNNNEEEYERNKEIALEQAAEFISSKKAIDNIKRLSYPLTEEEIRENLTETGINTTDMTKLIELYKKHNYF